MLEETNNEKFLANGDDEPVERPDLDVHEKGEKPNENKQETKAKRPELETSEYGEGKKVKD